MKNLAKTINRVFILLSLLTVVVFYAQSVTGKSFKVSVNGTSPMHDWTMTSTSAVFTGTVNGNTITNVKFVMASVKKVK